MDYAHTGKAAKNAIMLESDFDSAHKTLHALMIALQESFTFVHHYNNLLSPPHINIFFAPSRLIADRMIEHFSTQLQLIGHFRDEEFIFIRKTASGENGVQRIRLEFTQGITFETLGKIVTLTEKLNQTTH